MNKELSSDKRDVDVVKIITTYLNMSYPSSVNISLGDDADETLIYVGTAAILASNKERVPLFLLQRLEAILKDRTRTETITLRAFVTKLGMESLAYVYDEFKPQLYGDIYSRFWVYAGLSGDVTMIAETLHFFCDPDQFASVIDGTDPDLKKLYDTMQFFVDAFLIQMFMLYLYDRYAKSIFTAHRLALGIGGKRLRVEALEPGSEVICIPFSKFQDYLDTHPGWLQEHEGKLSVVNLIIPETDSLSALLDNPS